MAAIYQWFPGDEQVWTTTLYPVEVLDSLQLSASITGGSMANIAQDEYASSGSILSFEHLDIVIKGPIEEDAYTSSGQILGFEFEALVITGPVEESAYASSGQILSFEFENLLVTVYTPSERLQLTADIVPSGCSMTPV